MKQTILRYREFNNIVKLHNTYSYAQILLPVNEEVWENWQPRGYNK